MIAALYVEADGSYAGLPGVDLWPEHRDARLYDGPHSVVAHPPCASWCQLASVNEARWGSPIGEDGGTFEAALAAVRRFGGVLEHPAYSIAWERFGLPRPGRGGWVSTLTDEGMTTEISQSAYGHPARKRTWLYAVGVKPVALRWADPHTDAVVGAGINSGQCTDKRRLSPVEAIGTPRAFRNELLRIARTARR